MWKFFPRRLVSDKDRQIQELKNKLESMERKYSLLLNEKNTRLLQAETRMNVLTDQIESKNLKISALETYVSKHAVQMIMSLSEREKIKTDLLKECEQKTKRIASLTEDLERTRRELEDMTRLAKSIDDKSHENATLADSLTSIREELLETRNAHVSLREQLANALKEIDNKTIENGKLMKRLDEQKTQENKLQQELHQRTNDLQNARKETEDMTKLVKKTEDEMDDIDIRNRIQADALKAVRSELEVTKHAHTSLREQLVTAINQKEDRTLQNIKLQQQLKQQMLINESLANDLQKARKDLQERKGEKVNKRHRLLKCFRIWPKKKHNLVEHAQSHGVTSE